MPVFSGKRSALDALIVLRQLVGLENMPCDSLLSDLAGCCRLFLGDEPRTSVFSSAIPCLGLDGCSALHSKTNDTSSLAKTQSSSITEAIVTPAS